MIDDPNNRFGDSVDPEYAFGDADHAAHHETMKRTGFWGARGAGCIILARQTGRLLIAHRSRAVEQGGTWGTWGGAIDISHPETPTEAVMREVHEECGYAGPIKLYPLYVFSKHQGGQMVFQYSNFLAVVDQEFEPRLDWESQGFRWCEFGQWPEPLHFGLQAVLSDPASVKTIKAAIDTGRKHNARRRDH